MITCEECGRFGFGDYRKLHGLGWLAVTDFTYSPPQSIRLCPTHNPKATEQQIQVSKARQSFLTKLFG